MNEYRLVPKDDELYHYGVIGMKWGVRRGRSDKAYAKASKKLKKIDKRIQKHRKKALKNNIKADSHWYGRDQYREMARRSDQRAVKQMRKAEKWVKKMDKVFSNTPYKVTSEQRAIGEKYAKDMNNKYYVYLGKA